MKYRFWPVYILFMALPALPAAAATVRPNIIVIVADDQGHADLGCANLALDASTPHLDRLAAEGVRFTQAYTVSAAGHAARVGLLTGVHPRRLGIAWEGGFGLYDGSPPTLAEMLGPRGYQSGHVGKFHYGDERYHHRGHRNFPLNHGFDFLYGFGGRRKHYLHHQSHYETSFLEARAAGHREGQSLRQGPMWHGPEKVDQYGLSTELFGAQARRFIRRSQDGPFYLQLAFNAVHDFTHQLPVTYLRARGLKGYPDWDPSRQDYDEWHRLTRFPHNPEGRAHYLGQLHFLDREVGKLLEHLQRLGIRDKTLIAYLGDNGGDTSIYADNGPLRGGKGTLFEGGLRIPLILSWPGQFPQGQVRSNVVSSLDLVPTFCRLLGLSPPDRLDGIDLNPLLRGQDADLAHETLVWETPHEAAVRHQNWKLHIVSEPEPAAPTTAQKMAGTFLHDLDEDPGEKVNLAEKHPERVAQLRKILDQWRERLKPHPER